MSIQGESQNFCHFYATNYKFVFIKNTAFSFIES